MPTITQEEEEAWTSSSTLNDPSMPAPQFNLNWANMRAASSVDEGIVNNDEYEVATQRLQRINRKTILIQNWNKESKMAKSPTELVDMDMFYRNSVDKYNARRKTLEWLMDICVQYYWDATPLETSWTEPVFEPIHTTQQAPTSMPRENSCNW